MRYTKLQQFEIDAIPSLSNDQLLRSFITKHSDQWQSDFDDRDVKILELYGVELSKRLMDIKWLEHPVETNL